MSVDSDPSVAEMLGDRGLVGFGSCDAAPSVVLIVWEAESEEAASEHLQSTLSDAQRGGAATREELQDVVPEGASVVDVEFDNSTVQWRSNALHIVINVLSISELDLSTAQVQDLHKQLVRHAESRLTAT